MSGVQGFIDQRQQAQQISRRQIGNGLKVPVPQTKLEHPGPRSSSPKPNKFLIPGYRSAHEHSPPSDSQTAQASNALGDGFDTDAEGLDNTTIMNGDYDSRSHQGSAPAISRITNGRKNGEGNGFAFRSHHPFLPPHDQRHDNQSFDQLQGGHLAIEGDDESYEESADEDDEEDEAGKEDGDEYGRQQGSIEAELLYVHNNPKFSQYLQEDPDFFKQAALREVLGSPTVFNITQGEAGNKSLRTGFPLQSRGRTAENDIGTSDINLHSGEYQKSPHGITKQKFAAGVQQSNNTLINAPPDPITPSALQQTVSVDRQLLQLPLATIFPPDITKLQSQKAKGGPRRENSNTNRIVSVDNQQSTMLPLFYPTDSTETNERNSDRVRQLDNSQEPMLRSTGNIGLGDDAFSAGEEPGMDDGHKMKRTAHEGGQNAQKRPRDLDLDYNQDQLSGMTFRQLNDEAFHVIPQYKGVELPSEIASGTLVQKLDYLVKLEDYDDKFIRRGAFIASLPIEEYEECGELMIQRFGEIVMRFKNARQQRRKVVKEFEAEVAKRQELVRGKIDSLEKDFGRLKRGGEDVVRNKMA